MNFQQILAKYRFEAASETDKGRRFERLMVNFLRTYQVYDQKFRNVWQWSEFPYHAQLGDKDIGVDLVAETDEGDWWAVQCKCYAAGTSIRKSQVDTFLGTSGRRFRDQDGNLASFSHRLWISTTNQWSPEAENALSGQTIPCSRLGLSDLEIAAVDWDLLDQGKSGEDARKPRHELRDHQRDALEKCTAALKDANRCKLISACGSGKTLTALRIAESLTGGQGLVVFLAPSIALIGQTLREWSEQASKPIHAVCVCSDPQVSRGGKDQDLDSTRVEDLALPASTDPVKIAGELERAETIHPDRLHVILSTYQSINRVTDALKRLGKAADLIICDEAHRTTGATLPGATDESHFVKVHNDGFIKAKKRLYMTATPRIYGPGAKQRAEEASIALCSMDDESMYGREAYHLGFGEAVYRKLLSDYQVLVLTVRPNALPEHFKDESMRDIREIDADDLTKLYGCLNALSKDMIFEGGHLLEIDPGHMRRAVAFCQTIAKSKAIAEVFNVLGKVNGGGLPDGRSELLLDAESNHVDGGMGASLRDGKMAWLKAELDGEKRCRILTNVRCLSEGVDVPDLDAVMFLSAKNSAIEVVQSVGRVMRRAEGKKFGYIIIPVVIPTHVKQENVPAILNDHVRFRVVWTVLNALKSHDDRFDAVVNRINLNDRMPTGGGAVLIGGIARRRDEDDGSSRDAPERALLRSADLLSSLRDEDLYLYKAFYARLVARVGSRDDMPRWAGKVADKFEVATERIAEFIQMNGPHKEEFFRFLKGLQQTLNPSVDHRKAIEMLAQHLVSKPIFEALFEDGSFVRSNPVSLSLDAMINALEDQGLDKNMFVHDYEYKNIISYISGLDNDVARQSTIIDIYDKLFKQVIPGEVKKLGITYTPIEVVDFINHSVAEVLRREFGRDISDEGVHIIDPFTGTGTFVTRLIQSRLLGDSLERKYRSELHANEIVLLAYYIASVNIESAFHDAMGEGSPYLPFGGICLTDTFQLYEPRKRELLTMYRSNENIERMNEQKRAPIMVILGNPPYSAGKRSGNDNARKQRYPWLDKRVADTYAVRSNSGLKKSLYDTYVKAFRWASDRIDHDAGGVVAFVSNAGWLDSNAMDGMRKCLAEEFSKVYVFNLRGNQRTNDELSKREGGKIFGSGSRTSVAITVLVKKPGHQGLAEIRHHGVGDYLTRERKLAIVAESRGIYSPALTWERITPNEAGDWLNQRSQEFEDLIQLGDKNDKGNPKTFFKPHYSLGLASNRDTWCYNSSEKALETNIRNTIDFYNEQMMDAYHRSQTGKVTENVHDAVNNDSTRISWARGLRKNLSKNVSLHFESSNIVASLYRPFFKQHLYFDRSLNENVYQLHKLFPTPKHKNLIICVSGVGVKKEFSALVSNIIPDLEILGKSQCFPRYYYQKTDATKNPTPDPDIDGYARHDAINEFILKDCQAKYGPETSKDDIFYYIYGVLHSEDYRTAFSAELKKMLPRLPLVEKAADFQAFSKAGLALADLHLGYETVKPHAGAAITGDDEGDFTVKEMLFANKGKKDGKTAIIYNHAIRIDGIPLEAYDYVVNGRSAIEWLLDRYQVRINKDSGIKNDPNDWARENGQPRYILDLLLRIITVSLETMRIVKGLPGLKF
jgi:predicted helicase